MSQRVAAPPLVDGALIRKYDTEGPCYTSYPAAARFQQPFNAAAYLRTLKQQCTSIAPISLYVHIPFGAYDFKYCARTNEIIKDQHKAQIYLSHLSREIELLADTFGKIRPVTQLQWGGGMAQHLAPAEMTELMHRTASQFKLLDSPNREYGIEIDPQTANKENLALLKGLGFNRVRISTLDFNTGKRSRDALRDLCKLVRGYGFDSLTFNLVYGHPEQSVEAFQETLLRLVELNPDRISLQEYGHMHGGMQQRHKCVPGKFCSTERQLSLQIMACQTFLAHGYILIGMQLFVRPHDALREAQKSGELKRNLQGYSAAFADDLLGVGVSALSSVGNFYTQNECLTEEYVKRLDLNHLPIARGYHLSADDDLRRYVIMQVVCNLRLDFNELLRRFDAVFVQYFSSALPTLIQMSEEGLLHINNDELLITPAGRFMLRNICMLFDNRHVAAQELVQSQVL